MAVNRPDHYIVAVGASAGGLEAIHEFFDHMPEHKNLSFIVIQHLSPDYKSLLVELVARHTEMKVFEAADNQEIELNCVYVIPNNKFITIQRNKLVLADKNHTKAPNNAIDVFLYSLAAARSGKAVSIILSGTGSDGTKGAEAIKLAGGMVMVQEPSTAKFDGMPNSAINSGNADVVLSPAEMPAELISYINAQHIGSHENDIQQPVLDHIFELIYKEVGFDFQFYKTPTIIRRIHKRMAQASFNQVDEYVRFLEHDVKERAALGKDFLIGVTRFFRDTDAYAILEKQVLPAILAEKEDGDTLKIWVSACSTGEEAYSIAILTDQLLAASGKQLDVKIFATDIDAAAIDIAAKGVYSLSIEQDVASHILDQYFVKKGKNYTLIPRIRRQIVFARHDIIKDPPFIKNDLVTCRNMLIYMGSTLQKRIYSILLFAAEKDGYVFLGPSEAPVWPKENVQEISAKWKIYKKIAESRLLQQYDQKTDEPARNRNKNSRTANLREKTSDEYIHSAVAVQLEAGLNICSFYIDQHFEIKQATGNYANFLALPQKELHLNLLRMVPGDISHLVGNAVRIVLKEEKATTLRNIQFRREDRLVTVQILISPPENSVPYILVTLCETDNIPATGIPEVTGKTLSEGQNEYVAILEEELSETRQSLQHAIEDLETANEELQSSNEELLSANEELQSSNEELQSLNEELHTLNTEYQLKIRELIELNDDLNNYFRSSDIGQVFVDRDLNIRKFNPASIRMINFIEADQGRPLSHISNNIRDENLVTDVESVLRESKTVEKEVQLVNGRNLLMRILPYITHDKENMGAVIAFVDITTVTNLNNIIRGVFNSSTSAIVAFTSVRNSSNEIVDFSVQTSNHATDMLLHDGRRDYVGAYLRKELRLLADAGLFESFVQVVNSGKNFHSDVFIPAEKKWFEVAAVKMTDGLVASFTDITYKKNAEQKLRKNYSELIAAKDKLKQLNTELENIVTERTKALSESEERFRLVSQATNDALWDWNFMDNTIWWNDAFFKLFGYSDQQDFSRSSWQEKLHPDDRRAVQQSLTAAINENSNQWNAEYRFRKEDGTYAFILDRAYILHDEYGTPYRMLGSMLDLTELKQAEQAVANANKMLEQKVQQRTQELQEMNKELETSNNDLQQFASVASHDLQEPLRKIHMYADLLKGNYIDVLDDKAISYLGKVVDASNRMKALIRNILNFSRLSANTPPFEKTDMNNMLHGIVDDLEIAIKAKNALVHLGNIPDAEVIPGQLQQALLNIISNALKFSSDGIRPVIEVKGRKVKELAFDADADKNGQFLEISVKDNGIGFDEKFKASIFALFQRLHSKDKYEGTGIGLAIAKKITDRHNGIITARSKPGAGAEFIIVVPVHQST